MAEVGAAHDKIAEAMAAGQALTEIYEGLKKANRFSGGYKAFWKNVRKIRISPRKNSHTNWGHTRAEVISLRSQIMVALAEGRALKSIYNELKAGGRVSGTYQAFHKNVKKFCVANPRPPGSLSVVPSPATSAPTPAPPLGADSHAAPQSPPPADGPEIPHPQHDAEAEFVFHRLPEEELA